VHAAAWHEKTPKSRIRKMANAMRHDDGYEWPTYHHVYGQFPWSTDLYPVPIRCGLITPSSHSDGQIAMALGINDDPPVTITADTAERLREILGSIVREYAGITRRNEAKRLAAARQLLGDAGVVLLSIEQWHAVQDAIASDDHTKREQVLNELRDQGTT